MDYIRKYISFDTFILRTPVLVFKSDLWDTEQKDYIVLIKNMLSDSLFSEAVFLASPSLHRAAFSVLASGLSNTEAEQIYLSLLKYRLRMMTRATPFGLFAGVNTGKKGTKNDLSQNQRNYLRHTRLDMNYLIALAQNLSLQSHIRKHLIFYPNSSLYKIGNQWRYIEYYYEKSKRIHESVSIEADEYIDSVLAFAENGKPFDKLVAYLTDDEISKDEASGFILQMIENQLLVSELEPSVSGDEFIYQILSVLKSIPTAENEYKTLLAIDDCLQKLDAQITPSSEIYKKIKHLLVKLPVDFDENYLFQTDLAIQTGQMQLSKELIEQIRDTVGFLHKIYIDTDSGLGKFGKKLYERYENQSISLPLALDPELGLSIHSAAQSTGINPLIDDIKIQDDKIEDFEIKWHPVTRILYKKLLAAQQNKTAIIHLRDIDFKDVTSSEKSLPDTFSVMFHLAVINGEITPLIVNAGGSSAANLAARFAYVDKNIHEFIKEVSLKEAEINKDKIIAEIVHLPESRVGNILMRPKIRNYEIPYLARSTKPVENQIKITDLQIRTNPFGKINLYSKKHRKSVLPRLTNAHNYHLNALPVYHFLTLMQNQNVLNRWGFSWGDLEKLFEYFPRVVYKNTIISPSKWKIPVSKIQFIQTSNPESLLRQVKQWRQAENIPEQVVLVEGDNKLYVNLDNYHHIRMLAKSIRQKDTIVFEEFIFAEGSATTDLDAYFTNEIIIGFYKDK
jgi:hypothetical protein